MPGNYNDLWWIVLGALIGWLVFWLIDKFFRRDGEPADVDTVKALENVDTLEAQLKEAVDERDGLRKEADTQRAEVQRLGGLLETLRENNADQAQQITTLKAALDSAPDIEAPRDAKASTWLAGAGGLAAASAAAASAVSTSVQDETDAAGDALKAQASVTAKDMVDEPLDAATDEFDELIDDDAIGDQAWLDGDTDTFDELDDLSGKFPELEEHADEASEGGVWAKTREAGRSVIGRLNPDGTVDDAQDEVGGVLGRLGRQVPDQRSD